MWACASGRGFYLGRSAALGGHDFKLLRFHMNGGLSAGAFVHGGECEALWALLPFDWIRTGLGKQPGTSPVASNVLLPDGRVPHFWLAGESRVWAQRGA